MDVGRFAYSRPCRFYADHPEIVGKITWYKAPPGAKFFPGPHKFGQRTWLDDQTVDFPLGEINLDPLTWSNGKTPTRPGGQQFCGKQEYFSQGCPIDQAGTLPRDYQGIALCCPQRPQRGAYDKEYTPDYDRIV